MEFGVGYFPTHDGIGPGPLARMLEEHGQESLLYAEHSHIPAGRESPFPSGGPIPRKYLHTYDLFVALTASAAATSRLRIGSGIALIIQRDPIHTAKEVASVDHLSGGRFLFGIGAGWNREEMENHGTDYTTRMTLMRERVEAMKAIWAQDEASYHGKLVHIDRVQSWPKPVQRPHPPILVGGHGPKVLDRVLAFGDAWLPNWDGGDVLARIAELRARAERPIGITMLNVPPDPKVLEQLQAAGVDRASHWLLSGHAGTVERRLETWEAAIDEYVGG